MKKKIVSILLCVTMVAAMAVGCGSKDGGSDSKSESGDSKDKKYKVGITIQSLMRTGQELWENSKNS